MDAYGGTATTWASAASSTDPHWIVIDFGQSKTVDRVKIHWAWNAYQSLLMTSTQYKIQYWDGTDYVDAATVNNSGSSTITETTFSPVTTSRIRIYQPANMGPATYPTVIWLTELEIYGPQDIETRQIRRNWCPCRGEHSESQEWT
ncbi:MAG: discoidin domain-containing protein [Nitrospirae bacterium]|nr:discoidin domain-containing protein [Nitrospirota bacterium]MCL5237670.1 discoidin domain-containing protein [Nitrospirota bacterium]